jgi:transposase
MRLASKPARDYRWQTVIRLYKEGKNQPAIAASLLLAQSSVSRIIQLHRAHPDAVLQTKPAVGAQKRLSRQQLEQVKSWASQPPSAFGFEGEYWTRGRFRLLIQEQWGVVYQVRQVGNLLKSLQVTLQKPTVKDYRQQPQQVEEWKAVTLPAIKKKPSNSKGN